MILSMCLRSQPVMHRGGVVAAFLPRKISGVGADSVRETPTAVSVAAEKAVGSSDSILPSGVSRQRDSIVCDYTSRPSAHEVHQVIQRTAGAHQWQRAIALFQGAIRMSCVPLTDTYEVVLRCVLLGGGWRAVVWLIDELKTSSLSQRALYHTVGDLLLQLSWTGLDGSGDSDANHLTIVIEQLYPLMEAAFQRHVFMDSKHRISVWRALMYTGRTVDVLAMARKMEGLNDATFSIKGDAINCTASPSHAQPPLLLTEEELDVLLKAAAKAGDWRISYRLLAHSCGSPMTTCSSLPVSIRCPKAALLFVQALTAALDQGQPHVPWEEALTVVAETGDSAGDMERQLAVAIRTLEHAGKLTRAESGVSSGAIPKVSIREVLKLLMRHCQVCTSTDRPAEISPLHEMCLGIDQERVLLILQYVADHWDGYMGTSGSSVCALWINVVVALLRAHPVLWVRHWPFDKETVSLAIVAKMVKCACLPVSSSTHGGDHLDNILLWRYFLYSLLPPNEVDEALFSEAELQMVLDLASGLLHYVGQCFTERLAQLRDAGAAVAELSSARQYILRQVQLCMTRCRKPKELVVRSILRAKLLQLLKATAETFRVELQDDTSVEEALSCVTGAHQRHVERAMEELWQSPDIPLCILCGVARDQDRQMAVEGNYSVMWNKVLAFFHEVQKLNGVTPALRKELETQLVDGHAWEPAVLYAKKQYAWDGSRRPLQHVAIPLLCEAKQWPIIEEILEQQVTELTSTERLLLTYCKVYAAEARMMTAIARRDALSTWDEWCTLLVERKRHSQDSADYVCSSCGDTAPFVPCVTAAKRLLQPTTFEGAALLLLEKDMPTQAGLMLEEYFRSTCADGHDTPLLQDMHTLLVRALYVYHVVLRSPHSHRKEVLRDCVEMCMVHGNCNPREVITTLSCFAALAEFHNNRSMAAVTLIVSAIHDAEAKESRLHFRRADNKVTSWCEVDDECHLVARISSAEASTLQRAACVMEMFPSLVALAAHDVRELEAKEVGCSQEAQSLVRRLPPDVFRKKRRAEEVVKSRCHDLELLVRYLLPAVATPGHVQLWTKVLHQMRWGTQTDKSALLASKLLCSCAIKLGQQLLMLCLRYELPVPAELIGVAAKKTFLRANHWDAIAKVLLSNEGHTALVSSPTACTTSSHAQRDTLLTEAASSLASLQRPETALECLEARSTQYYSLQPATGSTVWQAGTVEAEVAFSYAVTIAAERHRRRNESALLVHQLYQTNRACPSGVRAGILLDPPRVVIETLLSVNAWQDALGVLLNVLHCQTHSDALSPSRPLQAQCLWSAVERDDCVDVSVICRVLGHTGECAPWQKTLWAWLQVQRLLPFVNWQPAGIGVAQAVMTAIGALFKAMYVQGAEIGQSLKVLVFVTSQMGIRVGPSIYCTVLRGLVVPPAASNGLPTFMTRAERFTAHRLLCQLRERLCERQVMALTRSISSFANDQESEYEMADGTVQTQPLCTKASRFVAPSTASDDWRKSCHPKECVSLSEKELDELALVAPLLPFASPRQLEVLAAQHFSQRISPFDLKVTLLQYREAIARRIACAEDTVDATVVDYLSRSKSLHVHLSQLLYDTCRVGVLKSTATIESSECHRFLAQWPTLLTEMKEELFYGCMTTATAKALWIACLPSAQHLAVRRWSPLAEEELRQEVLRCHGSPPERLCTAPRLTKVDIAHYWSVFHRILLPELSFEGRELCCLARYIPQVEAARSRYAKDPAAHERFLWELAAAVRVVHFDTPIIPTDTRHHSPVVWRPRPTYAVFIMYKLAYKLLKRLHAQLPADTSGSRSFSAAFGYPSFVDTDGGDAVLALVDCREDHDGATNRSAESTITHTDLVKSLLVAYRRSRSQEVSSTPVVPCGGRPCDAPPAQVISALFIASALDGASEKQLAEQSFVTYRALFQSQLPEWAYQQGVAETVRHLTPQATLPTPSQAALARISDVMLRSIVRVWLSYIAAHKRVPFAVSLTLVEEAKHVLEHTPVLPCSSANGGMHVGLAVCQSKHKEFPHCGPLSDLLWAWKALTTDNPKVWQLVDSSHAAALHRLVCPEPGQVRTLPSKKGAVSEEISTSVTRWSSAN